ncbi:hypothetical protein BDV98DRAFT_337288 [Pterulicium gracile]|uniref:Uncharacterized protein n=1 Tax=Pterulicium gracile TaxID=1884261 RepID=A0A5C3Q5H0_9AGAR|nr:hypothetical protein BDV98DRAFT_337288 [Pterula gracilis]
MTPEFDSYLGSLSITKIPCLYWGLTLVYNIAANGLIVGRLLYLRARVVSVLGKEFGRLYTGLAAMLMESSALYSAVLILGYLLLPGGKWAANVFSPLVAQVQVSCHLACFALAWTAQRILTPVQVIAAELIILRFALGRSLLRKDVVFRDCDGRRCGNQTGGSLFTRSARTDAYPKRREGDSALDVLRFS